MKKTFSLAGAAIGGKAIALERITVEVTKVGLPSYEHVITTSQEADKALMEFVKLNAKEVDIQTFGRTFLAENEGKPYFELEKFFGDFKKGKEIRFKGDINGELKKNNTYEITLRYLSEITIDGKVVYPKQ
ncbi:MAG: hypothetical protein WA705_25455 [Candidatus Ozemobacteraceae bacterium]